jgi:hypothetical protein
MAAVPRVFLCALFFDGEDVHLVPRLQISTLQIKYNIEENDQHLARRGIHGNGLMNDRKLTKVQHNTHRLPFTYSYITLL